MRLPITILPLDIIEKYDLKRLAVNGWVYLEIRKGMYGLKQAGLLANQLLQKRLKPFGYYPARHTPGLWLHNTKPTAFSLVVDDFAAKYVTKSDANHLCDALLQHYEITTDWEGTVYSGVTLDWDFKKRTCDISMPGYITNVLNKFQHDAPRTPQHIPSKYITPVYGAKMQFATQDNSPPLAAKQCTEIQKITGSVLYYSRALNPTVLMALNDRVQSTQSRQAKWLHPERRLSYQKRRGICCRIGSWRMLPKCTECSPLRTTLLELVHKQPATPLRKDNSTAYGILNETIKQKRSTSMDMKYYWLPDRVRQKQFDVYWRPGKDNLGDYHTKNHPAQHHQDMRPILLYQANSLNVLRVCA
jgi:hypothetical protein